MLEIVEFSVTIAQNIGNIAMDGIKRLETRRGREVISWTLMWLGLVAVAMGLETAFTYGDDDKLVGGDAFNLQILADRGVALVCSGVAFELSACLLMLTAMAERVEKAVRGDS